MSQVREVDFVVIGAGIAGASAAAQLAAQGSVLVVEAEEHAGYHSTGRSAALISEIYGNEVVRRLTRASRGFLFEPPADFAPTPLVTPRNTMFFGTPEQLDLLLQLREDPEVAARTQVLSSEQALERVPALLAGYIGGAVLETGSADIDVDALHQGFLRQARAHGAQILTGVRIEELRHIDGRWHLDTPHGCFSTPVVVNAAGAWGDEVARSAGVVPLGLQPKRRTAALIDVPGGLDATHWPAVIAIDEQFYFKPDAGLLLISPADETDSPPCDAQPEELDVAIAVDRFEHATGAQVRRIVNSWAGLRVFSPDRTPVAGFDPAVEGFFWLVGQGGYGIQTAVALGRLTAALCTGNPLPQDLIDIGLDAQMLSPKRFSVER
ncbi:MULTISPECIES: NAD(P)/FAD-dependent oxidoreductase [Pseudomonas]|uniref:NAD(P)/FAD-dependent oxidoreductase n=1 Tax=Pseudomonas guariconensis TaxID=1288410 RepID=UPI0020971694|nr:MULTISPECIES: FAD-binding oxidoreductase [Pseudomonas]MCO7597469.1 FAD-binding oxidoreductase [Pseudomonas guariconensis]MCU7223211.1 FAD-binding oxidoreductase [Pseudomonas brassicacearum]